MRRNAIGKFLGEYGVLVAFILLLIVAVVWQGDTFLKPENIRNVLNQNAAVGIIAVGMTLVIIVGGIDLSVGSMAALIAALSLEVINRQIGSKSPEGTAVVIGTLISLGAGLSLGFINGLIITLGRIPPFIATLGGLVAFRSLTLALANGGEIRSSSPVVLPQIGQGGIPLPFLPVAGGNPLIITWPILLFFVIAILGSVLLNKTKFGRRLIAVGANERAARFSAINTNRIKLASYTLMGACASVAAISLAGRMNSVSSSQMGLYMELDAIAAVVIGGTSMAGGKGRIWGTVVGVLILGIINNLLIFSGVSPYWQGFVKGVIIVLAVLIQRGQNEQ